MTQTLYCQEGSSDKHYTLVLEGCDVTFTWGPRGSVIGLATYTLDTPNEAQRLVNTKLKKLLAKGYRPGENAAPVTIATKGIPPAAEAPRPMLLNDATEQQMFAAITAGFSVQEKHDGVRCLIVKTDKSVIAWSRTSKPLALPTAIVDALAEVKFDFTLDGELVNETFWAFDILTLKDADIRPFTGIYRYRQLEKLFTEDSRLSERTDIRLVQTAHSDTEITRMIQRVRAMGGEGIVLKDFEAPYDSGRPGSGGPALKFKFKQSATVQVAKHNTQRSVLMVMREGTKVGSVTIPPNHEIPPVGSLIEVEYLYARVGGSLIQPVLKYVREDVMEPDHPATLKYKAGSEDAK